MTSKVRRSYHTLLIYLVVWSLLTAGMFHFVRSRHNNLSSEDLYEHLILSTSSSRPLVEDPCTYSIYGDPPTAEDNFAKVFFYCDQNRVATNSFHLGVLKTNSYRELLKEIGRINSFQVLFEGKDKVILGGDRKSINQSWKCFSEHKRISNFDEKVKKKSKVECFFDYSDVQIKKFYENN